MLYSACVYEPMIVFGSGSYADSFHSYLAILVRSNLVMLAAVSAPCWRFRYCLGGCTRSTSSMRSLHLPSRRLSSC